MRVTKSTVRANGGVAVVDLNGAAPPEARFETLRDTIQRLLHSGSRQILLNLAEVSRIDRPGVGELIAASIHVARGGGEMRLIHVNERVKGVLERTRLCEVLRLHADEESAINSFTVAAHFAPGSDYFVG